MSKKLFIAEKPGGENNEFTYILSDIKSLTKIELLFNKHKQIILRNLSGKIIIDFAGISEYKFLKNGQKLLTNGYSIKTKGTL